MEIREYESVMKAIADPTRSGSSRSSRAGRCASARSSRSSPSVSPRVEAPLPAPGSRASSRTAGPEMGHYSLSRGDDSPYAARMLLNLRGWLNEDPVIAKDRGRAAMARAIGPLAICERNMTLPGRKSRTPKR